MAKPKPKKKLTVSDPLVQATKYEIEKELATQSFHEFVRQAWHVVEPEEEFCDNWHIQGICAHLEAVTDGRINNLLINVPPGTMKSYLVCVFWLAWVWIRSPGKRFMFSSYSETLSMRDSQRTRDLLRSEWYQDRWPLLFSDSQDTKGKFENKHGGWRLVGSVKGKGIGEHPDFNVADDPHNVLEAESDAERLTVTRWIEGVFSIRGKVRRCKRVIIMQRLHVQDASGVALEKGGYIHICLPMRYEEPEKDNITGLMKPRMSTTPIGWNDPRRHEGELLWPQKYSDKDVQELEVNLGLYGAAGQLQQRPAPRGGGMFKRIWFEILTAPPQLISMVRYWDKAGTKDGSGARTAGVLMGTYHDSGAALAALRTKYIVLDVITARLEAAEREALIKQTTEADRQKWGYVVTRGEQEPGSGGKESAQATIGNLAGFTAEFATVTGSKEVRAEPLASQASVGKVKLLAGKWNAAYLDEIESFPLGKLRDMVDGSSGAFNMLNVGTGAFSGGSGTYTSDRTPEFTGERLEFDKLGKGDF